MSVRGFLPSELLRISKRSDAWVGRRVPSPPFRSLENPAGAESTPTAIAHFMV
jgi:hypothetical protein